jgi:hypothetical protein
MMEKERLVGVMILGWMLIIFTMPFLSSLFFIRMPLKIETRVKIETMVEPLIMMPTYWDYYYWGAMSAKEDQPVSLTPESFFDLNRLWAILILASGVLLLLLNNFGRMLFLLLCIIGFIIQAGGMVSEILFLSLAKQPIPKLNILYHIKDMIIPLIYVFYLVRPKVKEQFK